MEEYQQIVSLLALGMGAAWASGINLYATILMLGLMGMTGNIELPPDLQVLASPMVIAAAGLMYMVEFTVDKIPGVDSGWDAIHTLVRVPAGAVLAAGVLGEVSASATVAAAIVGGGVSLGTHAAKSGSRVVINSSPEPFSNWTASIIADLSVFGGLWTALNYPSLFLVLLIIFIILLIWLLPKLWVVIKKIFSTIKQFFSGDSGINQKSANGSNSEEQIPGDFSSYFSKQVAENKKSNSQNNDSLLLKMDDKK